MELRGRGRGAGCSEAGSLGAGMVGAKGGRDNREAGKGRTRELRIEGRMKRWMEDVVAIREGEEW